jgi:zinc protease
MGGNLNATVVQDASSVGIRGLSAFTGGLLDLLADIAINPTFPEDEIAILKANQLQAIQRQRASPQFVANREFRRALFRDHPYARVTSTPEAIAAIDRAALVSFHAARYRPERSFLLIVGDVEPAAAFALAEKAFGGWARGAAVAEGRFPALPSLRGRRVLFVQRPGSVQSSIALGNFAVKRADPAWFGQVVANTIFGGAFDSRIVRNIREEKGYTYSPQSQLAAFADAGFYRFAADVRNDVTGPTLQEVFGEIDRMRTGGADGAELEGAKQYLRGVFLIQNATQSGVSQVLNTMYIFGLPKDYLDTYQANVSAVGTKEVKAAAEGLLSSTDSVIVVVGDYAKVKDQLAAFKDISFVDVDGRALPAPPP